MSRTICSLYVKLLNGFANIDAYIRALSIRNHPFIANERIEMQKEETKRMELSIIMIVHFRHVRKSWSIHFVHLLVWLINFGDSNLNIRFWNTSMDKYGNIVKWIICSNFKNLQIHSFACSCWLSVDWCHGRYAFANSSEMFMPGHSSYSRVYIHFIETHALTKIWSALF